MTTPSDIAVHVREYLDLEVEDASNALFTRWCQEAQRVILNSRPRWAHLESSTSLTTTADLQSYTVTDLKSISAADCDEVGPLAIVDEDDARARFYRPNGGSYTSTPWAISRWGVNTIKVWPIPDDEYTITFQGYRSAVTPEFTGTFDLADDVVDAVYDWVFAKAYMQQDDPEMAEEHRKLFRAILADASAREDDGADESIVWGGGFGHGRRKITANEPYWTPSLNQFGDF
jgi:hypothetical protein